MGCSNGDRAAAQALHGGVKGGGGAGRGFVEEGAEDAAFEDIKNALALDTEAHFLGHGEEDVKVMAGELRDGDNVLLFEWRMGQGFQKRQR